jgi:hypothetical protein
VPQMLEICSRLAECDDSPVLSGQLLDEVHAEKSVGAGNETMMIEHDLHEFSGKTLRRADYRIINTLIR